MAPPTSSDCDLIRSLRAGDAAAVESLGARYRPLVRRLALATRIPPDRVDDLVDRVFDAAVLAVTTAGPAPVDFGTWLAIALRDEVAADPDLPPAPVPHPAGSRAAAETVMHDARLASDELVASWRMLLWAVHVEQVELGRAAQVAGIPPAEASTVLRRAEEAMANGVVSRAVARADATHAPFLRLIEQRSIGGSDADAAELLAVHTARCEDCRATGGWLTSFRSTPGAMLAAATLGSAAQGYLLAASSAARPGTAVLTERSRGLLVTAVAVAAALGLLVVAITAPGVSTLSAQLMQQPAPTTADGVTTRVGPTTAPLERTTPRPPSSAPGGPQTSAGLGSTSVGSIAASTDSRPVDADIRPGDADPETIGNQGATTAPAELTTAVVASTPELGTPSTGPGSATSGTGGAGTTELSPPASVIVPVAPNTTAPPVTRPTTGPTTPSPTPTMSPSSAAPSTSGATGVAPPATSESTSTSTSGSTRPAPSRPTVPGPTASSPTPTPVTSTTVTEPAPSLIGVRLADDWSHLQIGLGLGFRRTTTLLNSSDRTSAPVVVVAQSSRALLMGLSANGQPCGRTGVLADSVSCAVGPLAPGETVALTFSATLPLHIGGQTVSVSLDQQ